jgi:hypothetical protein
MQESKTENIRPRLPERLYWKGGVLISAKAVYWLSGTYTPTGGGVRIRIPYMYGKILA